MMSYFWARSLYVHKLNKDNLKELHDIEERQGHRFIASEIRERYKLMPEKELTDKERFKLEQILYSNKPQREPNEAPTDKLFNYMHQWDNNINNLPMLEYRD